MVIFGWGEGVMIIVFFLGGQGVRVIFGWGVEGGDGNFWVGGKGVIVSFLGGWVRV